MPKTEIENLPQAALEKRRFLRFYSVLNFILAGLCFACAIGVLVHAPLVVDLFGTNPRVAAILAVIGIVSLVMGACEVRQARSVRALKELAYQETDERTHAIRAKAGSAFGLYMFAALPLTIIAMRMMHLIDDTGMAVLVGMLLVGGIVWASASVYFQKRC